MKNRKKHNIFLMSTQEDAEQKWYYKDEAGFVFGPFTPQVMNDHFVLGKIKEGFMIKEQFTHDDFVPFKHIIKKYYRKLAYDIDNQCTKHAPDLKTRTKIFRTGESIKNHPMGDEHYKPEARIDRINSTQVMLGNLYFFDNESQEDKQIELNAFKRLDNRTKTTN